MESPCIQVCEIDEVSGLCAGCYRSLGEIASWASLDSDRRHQIMTELPARARLIAQRRRA